MASRVISSTAAATVSRSPAQASMVAPFNGLKSTVSFPVTKKNDNITSLASNGGRVQCMQVWPPIGRKKFETLSYLPPLSQEQLLAQIQYLLNNGWVPCLEFELEAEDVDWARLCKLGYAAGPMKGKWAGLVPELQMIWSWAFALTSMNPFHLL